MKNLKLSKLSNKELILLLTSSSILIVSFLLARSHMLYLIASLVGLIALMYMAKGEPLGQILTIIFSVLYAIIAYRYRYYGEMITYLFMTLPSALIASIIWLRNPYNHFSRVVKVSKLNRFKIQMILILSIVITLLFYYVLKSLNTPNLLISTLSILTSFLASLLTFFRSRHYALFYALNDLVLMVLWTLATLSSLTYLPMIVCFGIFFIHDLYAFVNWKKIESNQLSSLRTL